MSDQGLGLRSLTEQVVEDYLYVQPGCVFCGFDINPWMLYSYRNIIIALLWNKRPATSIVQTADIATGTSEFR